MIDKNYLRNLEYQLLEPASKFIKFLDQVYLKAFTINAFVKNLS